MTIQAAILESNPRLAATYVKRLSAIEGIEVTAAVSNYAALTKALSELPIDVLVAQALVATSALDPAPCYLIPNVPALQSKYPDLKILITTTDEPKRLRRYVIGIADLMLLGKLEPGMLAKLAPLIRQAAGQ